jgi:hypothetical protein
MCRDPDGPTSELYRLLPPRPRSELKEARDAALVPSARGQVAGEDSSEASSRRGTGFARSAARRILPWLGDVLTGVLIAVLAALIVNYLSGIHSASPGSQVTSHADAMASSRP